MKVLHLIERIRLRVGTWAALIYLAAASLVGVDLLVGLAMAVPESFPLILLGLALVYVGRRFWVHRRARRVPAPRP